MTLNCVLIPCHTGGYTAVCPEIKGAVTQGATGPEAVEALKAAINEILTARSQMWAGVADGTCGPLYNLVDSDNYSAKPASF